MEADLQRYYQIDYRDRWRGDLTLRRLSVLVRHLPPGSATSTALNGGDPEWTRSEVLLTDLWSAWAGKEHPRIAEARKKGKRSRRSWSAQRLDRYRRARQRARERKRKIASGEIT